MRCTITLSGSSHATHSVCCDSIKSAVDAFDSFRYSVGRYGDETTAEGLICVNEDPAWLLTVGPRGGIRKESC